MERIEIKNIELSSDAARIKPLPIVEIFGNTIQGEGPRLRPAIFVRTGLCNFKCEGFGCTRIAPNGQEITGCDTIHAVSPKFKETWTHYEHASMLISKILSIAEEMESSMLRGEKPDIILTGGEPTMHWSNPILQQMLRFFVIRGHHITVETNASKMITFSEEYQRKLQFSMSVKLAVSGERKSVRLNYDAINNILQNTEGSYFKFVVNPETWDVTEGEIREILENTEKAPVYLMPLGETIEKQLKNIQFVFDVCAKYGFNFSPRAHILAYNDKDGV